MQKPTSERKPYPAPGNADKNEITFHQSVALAEEVSQLSERLDYLVARMSRNGIHVLPEITRLAKRFNGADDLKAFVDVLEDTINHEIRHNVIPIDDENLPPRDAASDAPD